MMEALLASDTNDGKKFLFILCILVYTFTFVNEFFIHDFSADADICEKTFAPFPAFLKLFPWKKRVFFKDSEFKQ